MVVFSAAVPPKAAAPSHTIDVHIAGPLAMVEVWRSVETAPHTVGSRQAENTLDLNLPAGAALLDWEIVERAERARLAAQTEGQVSAGLAAALKMRQLAPSTAPLDEGTDYRIHITPLTVKSFEATGRGSATAQAPVLHYRFAVPVGCGDAKLQLHMPEALEENPVPADVTVTIEPSPEGWPLAQATLAGKPAEIRSPGRRLVLRGLSPARAAWDITWAYAKNAGAFPGPVLLAAGAPGKTRRGSAAPTATLALACLGHPVAGAGSSGPAEHPARPHEGEAAASSGSPSSVMLLIDRSRSVGQGGLSEERVLARALLEALPPSVPFNAILFGESATPLFPLPRMPTREALEALSNAADPNRLEKTTDVAAALARAQAMGATDEGAWIILITDGALPASQTGERMLEALSGKGEGRAKLLVLLVRQRGDDGVPGSTSAAYAKLVAKSGGLIRDLPPGSAEETAGAVIAAMHMGGDWFDLRMGEDKLSDLLAAGQSTSLVFPQRRRLPRRLRFSARGASRAGPVATIHVDLRPATVPAEWIEPLVEVGAGATGKGRRRAWAGATSTVAIAVLPATPASKPAGDDVVHGRLDETVLRNALSLAFMPRARACYLSRRVASANDANLRGRVRLELTIERGELDDAVVRKSTLNNPDVETCLRNAAWAVEYPRPEHRDALTVANLNLVFRPHTAEETRRDASPLDREIELILGPLTFTADFSDLLDDKLGDKVGEKSAAP